MKSAFWLCGGVFLVLADLAAAAAEFQLASPNGQVRFQLLPGQDRLKYQVTAQGHPVIEPSDLRLRVDETELCQNISIGKVERYEIKEQYPWRGAHAEARHECRGASVALAHRSSKMPYTLEVRACDDGVAFRFIVPGSEAARVPDESTRFQLPAGTTVWYHDLGGHYEAVHSKKSVADLPAGEWAAPPVTCKLPADRGYAAITEAALVNYSGMALQTDGDRGFQLVLGHKHPISYPFRLRYSNDIARVSQPAAIAGTITTPWRVILVGADLNALVNSDLVHNLCPAPDPKLFPKGLRTDWIKPGRAVWKYLDGGRNTFEEMKDFSRWASELGFEYHVIEGFWSRWPQEQVKGLADYSRERGVGLWLWKHSRDLRTPAAREEFFRKLRDVGVVGAKIDFFDHEHQEVVEFYTALLKEAAKYQVMVNFHGANKPTGEVRTWPNEMIREGVRGMESSRLKERARHNTTLPFTRYLAGHGDYTPVHFGERRGDTTHAHQIATAAVFTEPLLTYGAHPTNLLNHPALEMIKSIPAVWDETRVLPISEIGELAAFARRHGSTWFLAILNGPAARTIRVPLSFLKEGEYQVEAVRDDPLDAAKVVKEASKLASGAWLEVSLRAGGGYLARFREGP